VYGPGALLLLLHVTTAFNMLGNVPWLGSRILVDKIEVIYLAIYFLGAGVVFYKNFREAPSGVLRQQLKWLTGGTFAGSLPFAAFYVVPYVMDAATRSWMRTSVL